METYSNKDKIFLGRGKGMIILNAIKNAKESVKIVSPYLSPDYVKELINLSEKGILITLITCDEVEINSYSDFRHSDIIKKKRIENQEAKEKKRAVKKYSMIFLLASLPFFMISVLSLLFIYLALLIIAISLASMIYSYFIKEYSYEYYPIFRLKVFDSKSGESPRSTNLIHSKIFLVDNKILFLGSANFTYSAFKTHYETIIKVEDLLAINNINQEIENIFNSTELKPKSIQDWGREIYE